jgi:hypothetical protein
MLAACTDTMFVSLWYRGGKGDDGVVIMPFTSLSKGFFFEPFAFSGNVGFPQFHTSHL